MAANNLRITYQNMIDFPASTITASSTASAAMSVANLEKDTRSLIWRSSSNVLTNYPVIFKESANIGTAAPHTSITVSGRSSSGTPATWYATVTGNGATEAGSALQVPATFTFANTEGKTDYTVRLYQGSGKTGLSDTQVVPVLFENVLGGTSNALRAVLSNSTHTIPSTADGVTMTYTDSGTNVFVFEGTTPLKYDGVGTANGTWTLSGKAGTSITPGATTIGANGSYAIIADHSAAIANSSSILYTVSGKRMDGSAITGTTATQSFTKGLVLSTTPRYTVSCVPLAASANLVLTFPTTTLKIGLLALTLTNLSSTATIRVRGFTGTAPTMSGGTDAPTVTLGTTTVFDTLPLAAAPFTSSELDSWTDNTFGTLTYGLNKNTGRVYIPVGSQAACTSLLVEIFDYQNTSKYIEASRIIVGPYWSPTYNTGYGLSAAVKDSSTSQRSEAGDTITTFGVVYNSMSFDMEWLTSADRIEMAKILRINGMRKPMFISLFPENVDDYSKEQAHQIYGKLTGIAGISHPYMDLYSSQIEIDEV